LNTGSGIKYPDIAQFDAPLLAPEDQI
jgi:hypothetical protein